MSYKYLTYKIENNIAFIDIHGSINNHNEFIDFALRLSDICAEIQSYKQVRVIFLVGKELNSFVFEDQAIIQGFRNTVISNNSPLSFAEPLNRLDQPVIAMIQGDAVGLGLELALACDLRFSSESSGFGLTNIHNNMIPWNGGTQRLARLVGKGKAMELILTGELIDALEAVRIGLINRIFLSSEFEASLSNMVTDMASKAPVSFAYAKEAINKGMDLTLDQGLRLEADLYFLMHTTRDREEGIKAFQGKRKPLFEGI